MLVFALDRLWFALKTNSKLSSENFDKALKNLTEESKKQAGFDPGKYARSLQSIEAALELLPKI